MTAGLIVITSVGAIGPTAQAAASNADSAGRMTIDAAVTWASTPCVVSINAPKCQSTDPDLTVDVVNTGDTSACTFTWSMDWGDGSPAQQVTFDGAPQSGEYFLADHTYNAVQTQTYSITATPVSVTGGCIINSGNYTFTLAFTGLPAAPTNLAATPLDSTSILLTWTDNSDNESGFQINNGVKSQKVEANITSYTWGGLAPNTYMCFRIRANNSAGSSSWDPSVSPYYVCTTTPGAGLPAAPSNLAATPANSDSIRLTWTDISDNESGFEINNGVTSQYAAANSTGYTWPDLAPNTYMCFRIRANNSAGSSSWDPSVSPYYVCTTTPKTTSCPAAIIIGVHGVGEGPSSSMSAVSATLQDTYGAFTVAANRQGQPVESFNPINYRTVSVSDFGTAAKIKAVVLPTVKNVAGSLSTTLTGITRACPNMSVSLVGYSLGAWIINYMLITHQQLWPHINSVAYYGDPCWYNPSGKYTGLAQRVTSWCAPESTYPYPSSQAQFSVKSWCNNLDPICGQGYASSYSGIKAQFHAALNCTTSDGCTHLDYTSGYPDSGPTVSGGQFLESHAFG
jgi:hypothetical protein